MRFRFMEEMVRKAMPLQLASAQSRISIGAGINIGSNGDNGGPSHLIKTREMYLASERQPDIMMLSCSQWEDLTYPEHVTVQEMKTALGQYISIKLKDQP